MAGTQPLRRPVHLGRCASRPRDKSCHHGGPSLRRFMAGHTTDFDPTPARAAQVLLHAGPDSTRCRYALGTDPRSIRTWAWAIGDREASQLPIRLAHPSTCRGIRAGILPANMAMDMAYRAQRHDDSYRYICPDLNNNRTDWVSFSIERCRL